MTDFAKSVLDPEPAQPSVPNAALRDQLQRGIIDFASQIFSPPTDLSRDQLTGEPRQLSVGQSALFGFTSDPREETNIVAKAVFPNIPLEQAAKRIGRTREGDFFFVADNGANVPIERSTLGRILGGAGPAIPAVAGTTAAILTAPLAATGIGTVGTAGATVGASAAGEAGRQYLGDLMLGERSTNKLDPGSMLLEGAIGAAGVAGSQLAVRGAQRRQVADIARLDAPEARRAYEQAAEEGIDITPAEATGLPTLAAQQKRLTNITQTSDKMGKFLDRRNQRVVERWNEVMDTVSGAADAEDVGKLARQTAQDVLSDLRDDMLTRARPLYKRAYQEGDSEIFSPRLEQLTGSPSVRAAMRKAVSNWQDEAINDGFGAMNPGAMVGNGLLKFKNGSVPAFPNLQFWDYTKRAIDRQAEAAASAGQRDRARILRGLARKLRGELDAVVPGSYAAARRTYGTGADALETAMESALGIVAETRDPQIINAARTIFGSNTGKGRSPKMITQLRRTIEPKDPDAWQALKRLYLDDIATDALRMSEQGEVLNPAGKLYKAFQNERVRTNMLAAMTPEEFSRFTNLMEVYKRASSVPALRSDTEFNRLMSQEAEKAARSIPAKIAGTFKALNPGNENFLGLETLQNWLTDRNLTKHAEQAVDIITSGDPRALEQMKELRRLSPSDRRWYALFGQLAARGGFFAGDAAFDE